MVAKKDKTSFGRGLDIGTAFIVGALKSEDQIAFSKMRDAFLKIERTEEAESMMKKVGASFTSDPGHLYILGDSAIEVANLINTQVQRPMHNGVLSSTDPDASEMIEVLIAKVLGSPQKENEIVVYTIPGEPLNSQHNNFFNTDYHSDKLNQIISMLGFTPKPVNEAACIAYDSLVEHRLTGLALSFGAGMINVATMSLGIIGEAFSIIGSGDFVDKSVASAFNTTPNKITSLKEKLDIDITDVDCKKVGPHQKKQAQAIVFAYRRMIDNVIANLNNKISPDAFNNSIPLVIAGGTSLIKGFKDYFESAVKKAESNGFAIPVSEVIHAKEPLFAVARGALYRALIEESKLNS